MRPKAETMASTDQRKLLMARLPSCKVCYPNSTSRKQARDEVTSRAWRARPPPRPRKAANILEATQQPPPGPRATVRAEEPAPQRAGGAPGGKEEGPGGRGGARKHVSNRR